MERKLSTNEFADETGLTPARVRQLILDKILPAEKFGRDWSIDVRFIEFIRNRPEKRGRKPIQRAA